MAKKKFVLYWSYLDGYEKCPQKFLWERGWGDIDVGGGPGYPKPKLEKRSEHDAVLGIVVQYAIERFYNDRLWSDKESLVEKLTEITLREFTYQAERKYIDWVKAPSRDDMLQTCLDGVFGYILNTMKAHKLLGPESNSEVRYIGQLDGGVKIGGKVDMVIRRRDTGLTVLDGKNSKHKDKYLNPDQLRFYALCIKAETGELPDRLGFVYYRFPYDAELGEEGVGWIPCTEADLQGLAHRATVTWKGMHEEKFEATPVPSQCRFCDYESVCPQRQAQIEMNRKKRGGGKKKVTALEKAIKDSDSGFLTFDFDDQG